MLWLLLIVLFLFLCFLFNFWRKRCFVSLFNKGNVCLSGLRGHGKDVAFCLVVNSRKRNYISNVQYSNPNAKYQRFDFDTKVWELAGNTYTDFIDGTIKEYSYPYPDNIDYYISDAGVYFPSQYQNELCKRYKSAPLFQALSRHLGDCNIHCNSQRLNRLWDKIREQCDIYPVMRHCWIPKRFNPLKIGHISCYVYDNEEAAVAMKKPPFFGIGKSARESKAQWVAINGNVRKISFFFKLPYNYDSRRFKRILENNCKDYEE